MTFYWLIWSLLLLMFLISSKKSTNTQNLYLTWIICIISVFVGCRIDVGADWGGYIEEYYESLTVMDYFREPIFLFLEKVLYALDLPYCWFFLVMALIQMLCLKKAFQMFNIQNIFLAFFLFFSIFFCMTTLNVIRHGVMVSLMWLAFGYLLNGNRKRSIICMLVGAGFHFTALLFIPFVFFINKSFEKKTILLIIAVCFGFYILDFSNRLFNLFPYIALLEIKMNSYLNDDFLSEDTSFSMGQLFDLFIALFVYFKYNKDYCNDKRVAIIVNSLIFAFVINCTMYAYGVFTERIAQVFKFSLLFILPYMYDKQGMHLHKRGINFAVFSICIILYSYLYMNKAINTPDPGGRKAYQFQPYKIELSNYFHHDKQR